MQTKQVQAYSLINFLQDYDQAKAEGFVMSTDSGFAPVEIAGFYVTTMVKPDQKESVVQEAQEVVPESSEEDKPDVTEVKRGRKPKA